MRDFSAAPPERPRPLHRLTPLGDDPVRGWLGSSPTPSTALVGLALWSAYGVTWIFLVVFLPMALGFFGLLIRRVLWFLTALTGASLIPNMRRTVVRSKNGRMQRLARSAATARALQIDDWSALDGASDGRAVSLVGWVQARAELPRPVGGEPCVGISLACMQTYPGVLESVHDFDLLDDDGRTIPVHVAGARLLGEPNTRVFADTEGRLLVASLDLPPGAVSTSDALVLRNGDAVALIGFKTTVVDPSTAGIRQAPVRAVIASAEGLPLLICPIPGQRRSSPTAG